MAFNYEYPYTDAHRHNDDWLINKVKELALDWIKTSGEWTETRETFSELKNYIAEHFKNLDVQEEINVKLETMASDGTLRAVIAPLFNDYQQNIDVLLARMDAFTRLSDDATTGDAELTDARVDYTGKEWTNVGEHVRALGSQLSSEIANVDNVIFENNNVFEFALGTISASSGGFVTNNSAMVTGYCSAKKGQKIVFLNGWLGAVGYYTKEAQSGFTGISEVWVKEVIVPSDCFIRITAKNAQGTEIEDLTESAKNIALQYNLLELQNNGVANVKALGATGDGVSDDTEIIQKALNEYPVVYIPKGVYKISTITLNKYNVLVGDSPSLSVLASDVTDYCVIVPRSADHSVIKNIGTTSGIDIGHTGEASVQDMSVHLNSVYVTGGKGIFIGHRGGLYENCRIGGASQGFYVDGTDNVLSNCVASVIDKHGYATSNANNSFENCKAFCCGMTEWGTGFMIAGAFCRLSNCEAQQNRYENFYLKNTKGAILNGCISDGAFWNSDLTESTYTNKEFGVLNKGAIFIRNIENCMINVNIINGSLFGQTYGVCDYIFTIQRDLGEVKEAKGCNISVCLFNRNNYTCENSDFEISNYTADNYFLINGKQYLA